MSGFIFQLIWQLILMTNVQLGITNVQLGIGNDELGIGNWELRMGVLEKMGRKKRVKG